MLTYHGANKSKTEETRNKRQRNCADLGMIRSMRTERLFLRWLKTVTDSITKPPCVELA